MNRPITQHYYNPQDYQAQQRQSRRFYIVPAQEQKPTLLQRLAAWWQTLKRQATEDKITVTLEIVCICLLAAVVVAQAGILWNF